MASEKQESPWPMPKFHFNVIFGDRGEIPFQEATGLDTETDVKENRAANSVDFSTMKMPGFNKLQDVTLKKGILKNDEKLLAYFEEINMNIGQRYDITIQLLDEEHKPMFFWILKNAFPMSLVDGGINAGGEVVIETLVLAHEGLRFEKV